MHIPIILENILLYLQNFFDQLHAQSWGLFFIICIYREMKEKYLQPYHVAAPVSAFD